LKLGSLSFTPIILSSSSNFLQQLFWFPIFILTSVILLTGIFLHLFLLITVVHSSSILSIFIWLLILSLCYISTGAVLFIILCFRLYDIAYRFKFSKLINSLITSSNLFFILFFLYSLLPHTQHQAGSIYYIVSVLSFITHMVFFICSIFFFYF